MDHTAAARQALAQANAVADSDPALAAEWQRRAQRHFEQADDERIDAIRSCRDFGHSFANLTGHCERCGALIERRPRWRERLQAQDRTGEIRSNG